MPKVEQKQIVIDEIKSKIENAKSIILVNSRGLTVEQDTILRKKLREAGVEYKVYKNSMIDFAIRNTGFEELKAYLKGPTTVAICYNDPTIAASIINAEMKTMPVLEFKAGIIDGVFYDANGVKIIASIPSKEVLLSKLLGSFKAPMASFARLINAISEKNGESA
jgi:large subunit ribosomal protein L10